MRVTEAAVGKILNLIAYQPNKRNIANDSDLEGDFDSWFDGGAIRIITGSTQYFFSDGAFASVAVFPDQLIITIKFGDGRKVVVLQEV